MIAKHTLAWAAGVAVLTVVLVALTEFVPLEVLQACMLALMLGIPGAILFNLHLKKCVQQQLPPSPLVVASSWLLIALSLFSLRQLGPESSPDQNVPGDGSYAFLGAVIATAILGVFWLGVKFKFSRLPRERKDLMDNE